MTQPIHGFFHVRLWEAAFLFVFGLFLVDALILPGPDAAAANQRASVISMVVLVLQSMQERRDPAMRLLYPIPLRWPLASLLFWISLTFWSNNHDFGLAAGTGGVAVMLFVEVLTWRRAHSTRQAHP